MTQVLKIYGTYSPGQPGSAGSVLPRSVWQPARTSLPLTVHHRQPGDGALASKFPPHWAQFEADPWHHPVPSSPQSPQSASNLQHPPLPLPPPPQFPSPRMEQRMKRPDALSWPSAQPPSELAPGVNAAQASFLSATAQFASPMWCPWKKLSQVFVDP